ncbi:MAG: PAS domain-containing sensor histidine kinase [Candidatus Kapabacteria bacterium]|nr:PAS domain-containing sensor histidine kinase [Candidatus Kapabacteria bacterium]
MWTACGTRQSEGHDVRTCWVCGTSRGRTGVLHMRAATTIRPIITAMALLLTLTNVMAEAAYPVSYRRVQTIERGAALPHPSQRGHVIVVQPRPAWESARPALLVTDERQRVTASALPGADVRAAIVHRGRLVVAARSAQGIVLVVLDDTLGVIRQTDVPAVGAGVAAPERVTLASDTRRDLVCVLAGDALWTFGPATGSVTLVERGVSGFSVLGQRQYGLGYVYRAGPVGYLAVLDTFMRARIAPSVPVADAATIVELDRELVVLTPLEAARGTQITIVNPETSVTQFATVNVAASLLAVAPSSAGPVAYAIQPYGSGHAVELSPLLGIGRTVTHRAALPPDLGRPLRLHLVDAGCVIIMDAGIVSVDHLGSITSVDTVQLAGERSDVVSAPAGLLFVGDARGAVVLERVDQPFWWAFRFVRDVLGVAVPLALIVIVLALWRRIRRQRRLIDAMMELPGSGMVLHVDATGRLLRTNERAADVLGITANVPMRRLFRGYALHDGVRGLLDFVTASQSGQTSMTDRVTIDDAGVQREYMFTSVPLRTGLGRYNGAVITGVDITEALERRRLVNWAQLAHDMQTNLSTIRLNAEQLDGGAGADAERRRRILFQVGILIQRVRDLVSVGRSEGLHRTMVHSAELCTDLRQEFDPSVFPHVTFSMKLRGTMMLVDRLKVSRAVRNAIENGIKALRGEPGTIEIATWFDRSNVYIKVSDSGVGMDADTMASMMKPYFTTSSDGSGTGIGTMIMQHVVQQHQGSLRVTSQPGEGTQVVFRFPHGMEGGRLRNAEYAAEPTTVDAV